MPKSILIAIIVVVIVLAVVYVVWPNRSVAPTSSSPASETTSGVTLPSTPAGTRLLKAKDIPGVAAPFTFSVTIPTTWQAEAVPAIEAINIYDPQASGVTNLEKSQIFIRHFSGNEFLTLNTVTIHNREETTVNDRPAVQYDIEKKASAATFPHQPIWRNQRHIVTDVRVADTNPSAFYVIAKNPTLDQPSYDKFLANFQVIAPVRTTTLVEPVAGFKNRITKKPFGLYIDPNNSPVQPEKFTGYHTGVDVEYGEIKEEVPVHAIAAGKIIDASTAQGYGGVVAIQHEINGQPVVAIYGHLDPASTPAAGKEVKAGDTVGRLGDGFTPETDGERKHLHFGLYKGTTLNIRGYVQNQSELSAWIDPVSIF